MEPPCLIMEQLAGPLCALRTEQDQLRHLHLMGETSAGENLLRSDSVSQLSARDLQDHQAQLDKMVFQEEMVIQGHLEHQELEDLQETQDQTATLVLLVKMEKMESLAIQVHRVQLVKMEHVALLEPWEFLDHKVLLELQVREEDLEIRGQKDHQVHLDRPGQEEKMEVMDLQDLLDHPAWMVLQELKDQWDLLDLKEYKEKLELQDQEVSLVQKENQVLQQPYLATGHRNPALATGHQSLCHPILDHLLASCSSSNRTQSHHSNFSNKIQLPNNSNNRTLITKVPHPDLQSHSTQSMVEYSLPSSQIRNVKQTRMTFLTIGMLLKLFKAYELQDPKSREGLRENMNMKTKMLFPLPELLNQ